MARITFFTIAFTTTALLAVGCSNPANSPTSPTAALGGETANTAGVSAKVSEPTLVAPEDGERFVAETVTIVFEPSRALFVDAPVSHEVLVRRASDGLDVYNEIVEASLDAVSHALPALDNGTYEVQVRGAIGDARGPWSETRSFVVAPPSGSPFSPVPGTVGPARHIPTPEAIALIINLHNAERWNLGRQSSREQRVAFLWRAVAVLHYGHPVYNPAGPDPDWCVKDAGAGRPPSDDVIVRCSSREAWDIILSAGGDNYHFHEDYLGRLGREQNVYPPPRSSLP